MAHLDEGHLCVHLSQFAGDEATVVSPLKQIVRDALENSTAAIVLAHNHPSGDPHPSECDLRATRKLATVAEAIDCRLLDHLIFAGSECISLRALGFL